MYQNTNSELLSTISSCCENQRGSQYALYKRFFAYGMSIATRYVDSEEDAMTILNDSFLKVFDNIKKFDKEKPYKPWFRRILVNTAINFVKSKKRKNLQVIRLGIPDAIPSQEPTESRIDYDDLMTVLEYLSPTYKKVFNMYVIDGLKHKEIAELLDISVSTSKSNLTRARQKLRVLVSKKLESQCA